MSYDVLRQAILNKHQVSLTYKDHHREVCPHVIGQKNGADKVLTYQFGGTSKSDLPPEGEWRCMFVDEIANAVSHSGPWHTSHLHTQPQTCVDDVDVEVAY